MKKNVIRFVTAIALVIAITSAAVLSTDILAESKARENGKVDAGKITETGRVDDEATNETTETDRVYGEAGNKTTETGNVDEEAGNRTTETGKVDEKADVSGKVVENGQKIVEAEKDEEAGNDQTIPNYTIGTLRDFGVTDWRTWVDDLPVFPLSEYEELDESLKFLNNYEIYIPTFLSSELDPEFVHPSLNEILLYNVELCRQDISTSISEGHTELKYYYGPGSAINVPWTALFLEELYCVVADYYFGYNLTAAWS